MMVLQLIIMAGFLIGTGVPEVALGNEVTEVPETGVAGTMIVMMDFGVVAGATELIIAGLCHPEGVMMIG